MRVYRDYAWVRTARKKVAMPPYKINKSSGIAE
jgi:hypothetical protein